MEEFQAASKFVRSRLDVVESAAEWKGRYKAVVGAFAAGDMGAAASKAEEYVALVRATFPEFGATGESSTIAIGADFGRTFSRPAASTEEPASGADADFIRACQEGLSLDGYAPDLAIRARDSENRTGLHWAADRGHLSTVQRLVALNVPLDVEDTDGFTALHNAAISDHSDIYQYLLESGAALLPDLDSNLPSFYVTNEISKKQ